VGDVFGQCVLWYIYMVMTHVSLQNVAQATVFHNLPKEELSAIAGMASEKRFEKGEYIVKPYDESSSGHLFILKEGEVETYESTNEGKKIIVDILQPGDVFGYNYIFEGAGAGHKQFMKARKDAVVYRIPVGELLMFLQQKPEIAMRIICFLSAKLASAEHKLRDVALSNPETRLMQELERLYEKYGEETEDYRVITRRFTHEELANLIGMTRETISRLIPRLVKEEKIFIDKAGNIMLKKK